MVHEEGAMIKDGKFLPMKGNVKVGKGVHMQNFVSIKKAFGKGEYTEIGDNTYLCSFVNIGHNAVLGKNCFVAPGVTIVGGVTLGDNVYVGANSVIVQDLKIGSWVKIRAGSVVDRNIPSNTYWGKDGKCVPNLRTPR